MVKEIVKRETVRIVGFLDNLYGIFSAGKLDNTSFISVVNIAANFCISIHPLFSSNPDFQHLFGHVNQMLSTVVSVQQPVAPGNSILNMMKNDRLLLIYLIEKFENALLTNANFHFYLIDCKAEDIPVNRKYPLTELTTVSADASSFQKHNQAEISVLIHSERFEYFQTSAADFYYQSEEINTIENTIKTDMLNLDYYSRDKLYLEAKLDSLRRRQDIRLLLAGSSYTMCGLIESQMPLPARNVALDAQDIYYTLKTIRTALSYNSNIQYCIISFAYYLWGSDLARSTSEYNYKRITEVNYPIFKDLHNFVGFPDFEAHRFIRLITPLKNNLFTFSQQIEHVNEIYKKQFEDSDYFPLGRADCIIKNLDEQTNYDQAKSRAESHNKFFKYADTVKEGQQIFADFLEEMNLRDIQIIIYVPPATKYYQKGVNPQLIIDFYNCMNPLKERYKFKLIDLYQSDIFETSDFYDYDHLNDQGAKKLGERLIREIDIH